MPDFTMDEVDPPIKKRVPPKDAREFLWNDFERLADEQGFGDATPDWEPWWEVWHAAVQAAHDEQDEKLYRR